MRTAMTRRHCGAAAILTCVMASAGPAFAQNYNFDAREIGMGGVSAKNPSAKMVDEVDNYGVVGIPLGLFQTMDNLDIYNPSSDQFDPARAIAFAANPFHYTFGRAENPGAQQFVNDIVNGRMSRDLNDYRGFSPQLTTVAEGLAGPSWGKTIVVKRKGESFHGAYVGAGPYFGLQTATYFDQQLSELLGSETPVYLPNTTFTILNKTRDQIAAAVTGGYRGRLPTPRGWAANPGERDGFYISANFNYLVGMHYDDFSLNTRLDTDSRGLLTLRPDASTVAIDRVTSSEGRGASVDAGVTAVVGPWEAGVGARGLGNHITWKGLSRTHYALSSLFGGGDFEETFEPSPNESLRAELPTEYLADLAYHSDRWTAATAYAHGYNGDSLHTGLEYRLRAVDLRGGVRYTRTYWQPTGGVGVNLSQRVGFDIAFFTTRANFEAKPQTSMALSLRFNPAAH